MAIPSSFHPHFWGPVASTLALISFIPRSHLWHFSNLALTFPLCSLLLLFLLLTFTSFRSPLISPYLPLSPLISPYLPLTPLITLSLPSPHNSPSPLHAILFALSTLLHSHLLLSLLPSPFSSLSSPLLPSITISPSKVLTNHISTSPASPASSEYLPCA